MEFQVLIVGGGVSGLRIGSLLSKADIPFKVLESRNRLGGRVLTETEGTNYFDLGPTWYWPDTEKKIVDLIDELKIPTVEQYTSGNSLLELSKDVEPRRIASSEVNSKSRRIVGGVNTLVDALKSKIPQNSIEMNRKVVSIAQERDDLISVSAYNTEKDTRETYHTRMVILTVPPRLLLENIKFVPSLPEPIQIDLLNKPTWMGAQAKIVVTYDTPFWKEQELSGNVISWVGPLREIYDASTHCGDSALFGFFSLPPSVRSTSSTDTINNEVIKQLTRLFGDRAKQYKNIYYKDWSQDRNTVTEGDKLNIESFPAYGQPPEYQNNILFAGTEYDADHGGHLEGALASAEKAYDSIKNRIDLT